MLLPPPPQIAAAANCPRIDAYSHLPSSLSAAADFGSTVPPPPHHALLAFVSRPPRLELCFLSLRDSLFLSFCQTPQTPSQCDFEKNRPPVLVCNPGTPLPPAASASIIPTVRVEQGFGTGAQIVAFYDPMIAELVVHGADLTEALRMLRVALEEYKVVGVNTKIAFLLALASHPAFVAAEVESPYVFANVVAPMLSNKYNLETP